MKICPACSAVEIVEGQVVCDGCFEKARLFWKRRDFSDPALEEHKALRRYGDLATPWYDR